MTVESEIEFIKANIHKVRGKVLRAYVGGSVHIGTGRTEVGNFSCLMEIVLDGHIFSEKCDILSCILNLYPIDEMVINSTGVDASLLIIMRSAYPKYVLGADLGKRPLAGKINQNMVHESKATPPRFFSGDDSRPMWRGINKAETVEELQTAVYSLALQMQRFEESLYGTTAVVEERVRPLSPVDETANAMINSLLKRPL